MTGGRSWAGGLNSAGSSGVGADCMPRPDSRVEVSSEEERAEVRRAVLAWWRSFQETDTGVWLCERTGLLRVLSSRESSLPRRVMVVLLSAGLVVSALLLVTRGAGVAALLAMLVVWLLVLSACASLWMFDDAYTDSDAKAADWLSTRPGLASRRDAAEHFGPRAVERTMIPAVLPAMLERSRTGGGAAPLAFQAAMLMGSCHRMPMWLSNELHVYVNGPTRSGKTMSIVIPAIVEAPGFVLAASTRSDVILATRRFRRDGVDTARVRLKASGDEWVRVFDPEGVGQGDLGTRHDLAWTPLMGCDDEQTAIRRAQTMVGASGLDAQSGNKEWGVSAVGYVAALLYAAAISGRSIRHCYEWSLNPQAAMRAADIIRDQAPGMQVWADTVRSLEGMDPRQQAGEWFGVKNAFAVLKSPQVCARLDYAPNDPRLIDPREFIRRGGTVYALCSPRRQGTAGGNAGLFVALLLDTFQEACQDLAFEATHARRKIEPPAKFVLDELSSIEQWPGLRNAITQGGGNGYQLWLVEQDRSAARDDYGADNEQLMWNNCHRILMKGSQDHDNLQETVDMIGQERLTRVERSWNAGGSLLSAGAERSEMTDSVTKRELSLLARGHAIITPVGLPPALVRLEHFMQRDWWRQAQRRDAMEAGGR